MRFLGGLWGPRTRSRVGMWAVVQAGTTAKLHSSYNVSSFTDNGAGDFSFTLVIPFASASDYAIVCGTNATNRTVTFQDQDNRPTASSLRTVTINAANALTDIDPTTVLCVGRR